MAMTNAELEAKVAELEARLEERDPVRVLRRLLAEFEREGPKAASAEKPARPPDLDAARASAEEDLRQMRLRRRRNG
jgi:hypothetical protein